MKTPFPCCKDAAITPQPAAKRDRRTHVIRRNLRWILPFSLLAIIPKCPLCLAAYITAFTGLGISVTTASMFRTGIITLTVALAIGMAAKNWRRSVRRVSAHRQASQS